MTRRDVILTAIGATLAALPRETVLADLDGTRRQERANRRCWLAGERRERGGLTERERRHLERMQCKQENGQWMSSRIQTAGL